VITAGVGQYRFAEDVTLADWAVDLEGRDLDDLFRTAAAALAALMVDPATVRLTAERTVELEAGALDLLLHDWLSELIFLKDRDREVFTEVEPEVSGSGPYRLVARLRGGALDARHAALGADPKAVTLHQLSLDRIGDAWRARVVIDT